MRTRYSVQIYDYERTKMYSLATLLDPRYKLAGFQLKNNGTLAKEMLLTELSEQCQPRNEDSDNPEVSEADEPQLQTDVNQMDSLEAWDKVLHSDQSGEDVSLARKLENDVFISFIMITYYFVNMFL